MRNKEEQKQYNRAYYQTHREDLLQQVRQYKIEHRTEVLASKKRYRETHKPEISEGRKRFRASHRSELVETDRLYYEANKEQILAKEKEKRREKPEILLLRNARERSKNKRVDFSINLRDILVPAKCPVFGISIETGTGVLHEGSPTLDRVIPELGYVPGNVAVISHKANTIKSNGTSAEHRKVADWLDGQSRVVFTNLPTEKKHAKMLLDHARKRASKHGIPFSLKQKDIRIPSVCPILGIPLERGKGKMQESSPTIDRIVPEKGYVPENIAIVSLRANQIKSHGTAEEHRLIAGWIDKQLAPSI